MLRHSKTSERKEMNWKRRTYSLLRTSKWLIRGHLMAKTWMLFVILSISTMTITRGTSCLRLRWSGKVFWNTILLTKLSKLKLLRWELRWKRKRLKLQAVWSPIFLKTTWERQLLGNSARLDSEVRLSEMYHLRNWKKKLQTKKSITLNLKMKLLG